MKRQLLTALFLLGNLVTIFSPLAATSHGQSNTNKPLRHYSHFWTGNSKELYCQIKLEKGVEFDNTYKTFKTQDGGNGCEVTFKPLEDFQFLSKDGYVLEKTIFEVTLSNTDKLEQVNCEIITRDFYKKEKENGILSTSTRSTTTQCIIHAPPIKLNQAAKFSIVKNNHGVISFENLPQS